MGGGGTTPGVTCGARNSANSTTPPFGGGGAIDRDSGARDTTIDDTMDIMRISMFKASFIGEKTISKLRELLRMNEFETMYGELHLQELFEDDVGAGGGRDQLGRQAYEEMRGYFGHQRFFSGDDGALSPLFFPRWQETMMLIMI